MRQAFRGIAVLAMTVLTSCPPCSAVDDPERATAAVLKDGPLADPNFFPIAVWLQDPRNAAQYRAAGINVYVALFKGPTEGQLATLRKQGFRLVCSQNDVGLAHRDDPTIIAWMHGDEPDNAQALDGGKGYGPPIPAARIVEDYRRIKHADPTRPVMLNLGQGVAWDGWYGRGVRTNHPEDYAKYIEGCDIASFDIYPACHSHRDVAGKLWLVADGVSRLRKWSDDQKIVWNCIECTHIDNARAKATPLQVKAEVWMSLIRGSRGLIYFVHQFQPKFVEAALLADHEMLAEVTSVNRQIHELAPVLNSPSIAGGAIVESSTKDVPVEAMLKRHDGRSYLFAVCMREGATEVRFKVAGIAPAATAEVLGEGRALEVRQGNFHDSFQPWAVHLYRIR